MELITRFFATIGIWDFIQAVLKSIQDLFPKTYDSWQALVWFSLYSWLMAALAVDPWVEIFISSCAWLFLIPGVHWAMYKEKFLKESLTWGGIFIGPWITGALVCTFLFGSLTGRLTEAAFILWPPISAIIASLPKFVKAGPTYGFPDPPVRQDLMILFLVNLLMSCWIQFYFLTQEWLVEYPTLVEQNFQESAFVVRLFDGDGDRRVTSRGSRIIDEAAKVLDRNVTNLTWSETELWLRDLDQRLNVVQTGALDKLPGATENNLWTIQARVLPGTEYDVQLWSVWNGPSTTGIGYYFTKTCQIRKRLRPPLSGLNPFQRSPERNQPITPEGISRTIDNAVVARVTCGQTSDRMDGQPASATTR
ncbi:MAG TPA: DUF5357 family protein [Leptolyngbyaceae cyanobacterium M33_DOE_097]|uniref:DUF5357 domain-containing protein n=1 Tax=Oscillatoriales cyanobacterium SpSt-418 TaxID=2282169 RepID=A0A7C3KGP2_9CYAN|nr:DUF5357 family protein [Leptolyngbyaceae cyanobacterium M33_DOE_097]